ncbi:type VI secretion protein [Streptomyces sp. WAC00469]|uniref:type VI secretion protein n=1 Tax=Streptomyces sp. WAC00469 TaxID=2487415 RepID=UPI000F742D9F|nr:type VI secretion protein [Streptomyces sp. WAC00469]RSR95281.1 type VI secretion protein [Streptomyces sp. WAC00469]
MRVGDRGQANGQGNQARGQGGIPDGLLVGILAFLLGITLLVWTATGLAALLAHGAWPDGIGFTRTPLAMRHLIGDPHDLAGAWPDVPDGQLSGYGLFWGVFIGQLMVLFVLAVFVLGTLARWRAVRLRRRAERAAARQRTPETEPPAAPAPPAAEAPAPSPPQAPPAPHETAVLQKTPPAGPHLPSQAPQEAPAFPADGEVSAPRTGGGPATASPQQAAPLTGTGTGPLPPTDRPSGAAAAVVTGPRDTRLATATQAVLDAAGPAVVVTSNPALWHDTKNARAKLGPVLLYDPSHLCDTPARLHWSPIQGCEDQHTAAARAAAVLAPVRPTARIDQPLADTAQTLLRSFLHAAALDGRSIRHLHRWAQGTQLQDAVKALRTHPKAAAGSAGELEAALTSHPDRRDMAQELVARALAALSTVNVRESCAPNRADALALDSFVCEGGTLYLVGESLEDPRTDPGAMPLLTGLAASVVERGRRMAERSSSGRLDPPLTLVLDDVAAVAPLPQLPELLTWGPECGMPTLVLLRSREQARARWPHHELPY